MFRRTVPLIVFAAGLTACGVSDSPLMPLTEEALLAKNSGPTDPTATFTFDAGLGVQHDGNPEYANGVCGVTAKIFATEAASNSGDATMQTNNPRAKDRNCTQRTLTIVYDANDSETGPVFMNVREIHNTNVQIPVDGFAYRMLRVNVGSRCDGLEWAAVKVTRVAANEWLVESEGDHQALCRATTAVYTIPVRFTIVSSRDL